MRNLSTNKQIKALTAHAIFHINDKILIRQVNAQKRTIM